METQGKTINQNLSKARVCIDQAIAMVKNGEDLKARSYIEQAILYLQTADTIIIRNHITTCVPTLIKKGSVDQVISEIMKTYKYASS